MIAARVVLAVATIMTTISSQALAERTVRGVVVKVDGIAGIVSVREMHQGMAGAISLRHGRRVQSAGWAAV